MPDPPRSIVLTGFMGTGKSAVGSLLASALQWPFLDTDAMIEAALGRSITEIFARFGETRFRQEESGILQNLKPEGALVIVTGGGAVLEPENVSRMRQLGTVVCLTANLATLEKRLAGRNDRPLLPAENRQETLRRLLHERAPRYEEAADLTFDTSVLGPEEVATEILRSLVPTD